MEIDYIREYAGGHRVAEFTYSGDEIDSGYAWLVLAELQKLGYTIQDISTHAALI